MPRIDPIQLLKCLSVLLASNGGIRNKSVVCRLTGLMTKFSKKLVSKCIYIQILKSTERELLGQFMGAGGWCLVHIWLTESIAAKNWALVQELLELLLLCPVNIDRLKSNNCPKLVKELSKEGSHDAIKALASKLVDYWLKTVKDEPVPPITLDEIPLIILENKIAQNEDATYLLNDDTPHIKTEDIVDSKPIKIEDIPKVVEQEICNDVKSEMKAEVCDTVVKEEAEKEVKIKTEPEEKEDKELEALPILKITMKNGKQVIMKVEESEDVKVKEKKKELKPSIKPKHKESSSSKGSRSSSKHSSPHSSKSNDKSRSSSSSKSSSSNSKHKSKSKDHEDSHKDKSRDKNRHSDKEKSRSDKKKSDSERSRDRSKSERSSKEKKNEKSDNHKKIKSDQDQKNKETLEKLIPPSIHSLGKIPKKIANVPNKEPPSISIEVRKPNEPKPRTVKIFNSKIRSHGFEEEISQPPPRTTVKKPPPTIPPNIVIPKRSSPPHPADAPPEKKPKTVEIIEKPGSIKLIPPKPKPTHLLESDMFMDALTASATNKKEPRKRKRRTSGSKDGHAGDSSSPPTTPNTNSSSPTSETKSTPFKFYKDTLENEEEKEVPTPLSPLPENKEEEIKAPIVEEIRCDANGLRSVLCIRKKKGPKKSIRWRPDNELEEIQYFELDETERVNVSKTFTDMKQLDISQEKVALQKARNLINDVMEEKTSWRRLIPIEYEGAEVEYGKNSKEKDIQANRQKSILQSLYFNKAMIPDSPAEADPEVHQYSEPTIIPLEDVTGNPDSINDYRSTPWPEPKESGPIVTPPTTNIALPQVFPAVSPNFPSQFPNSQFPMTGFPGNGPRMPAEWQGAMPPGPLMGPNLMGPVGMQPPMGPPMMMQNGPPDMMPPDIFSGPPVPMFPGPPMGPDGFIPEMNGGPNMFGPGFGGPPPNDVPGFNNFRGNMRNRGWRGAGGGGGPVRGRGGLGPPRGGVGPMRGGRICIHFQKKGSCRSGDKCGFLHPGVNCPL